MLTAYGDDQTSVYDEPSSPRADAKTAVDVAPLDVAAIADQVVDRIHMDADFAALVAVQLGLPGGAALRTLDELIVNDEDFVVEFKSTARWDLKANEPNKAMEDAVVKTVAGFLNADGGTLLIGIGPDREVIGLEYDYWRVKPQNGDGFVNWLTTHLTGALGPRPSDADAGQDREQGRPRDLPSRRGPVCSAGMGQDEQAGPGLLRAHEQLDPVGFRMIRSTCTWWITGRAWLKMSKRKRTRGR